MLTYQDRIELAKKLIKEGEKSYRQIAKKTHLSPNTISQLKKMVLGVDADPRHTQAYKLFLNGKTVLEVALELGLPQEQAERYYLEYLKMIHKDRLHSLFFEDEGKLSFILELHNVLSEHNIDRTQYSTLIAKLKYTEPPQWQVRALEIRLSALKSRVPHLESSISRAECKLNNLIFEISEKQVIPLHLDRRIAELRQKERQFKQLIENAIKGDIEPLCKGVLHERRSFRKEMLEAFSEDLIPGILDTLQYEPGMTKRLADNAQSPEDTHWFSERLRYEARISIEECVHDSSKWQSESDIPSLDI